MSCHAFCSVSKLPIILETLRARHQGGEIKIANNLEIANNSDKGGKGFRL